MTNKINSKYNLDITKENEVFNITKELIPNRLDIAAIYWEIQFISLRLWYIFETGSWIADNRVTRYKGFIKNIKTKYNTSHSIEFTENILELKTDKKIKFFLLFNYLN